MIPVCSKDDYAPWELIDFDLREIAQKLVPKFRNFVTGARKFICAKIS